MLRYFHNAESINEIRSTRLRATAEDLFCTCSGLVVVDALEHILVQVVDDPRISAGGLLPLVWVACNSLLNLMLVIHWAQHWNTHIRVTPRAIQHNYACIYGTQNHAE